MNAVGISSSRTQKHGRWSIQNWLTKNTMPRSTGHFLLLSFSMQNFKDVIALKFVENEYDKKRETCLQLTMLFTIEFDVASINLI